MELFVPSLKCTLPVILWIIHYTTAQVCLNDAIRPEFCGRFVMNSNAGVFNYFTMEREYLDLVDALDSVYADIPVDPADFCRSATQKFFCFFFFPACGVNQDPITLCEDTCTNYIEDSVCRVMFEEISEMLAMKNLTIASKFSVNCSSFTSLYGINTTDDECQSLDALPFINGTVECNPIPSSEITCRTNFLYEYSTPSFITELLPVVSEVGSLLTDDIIGLEECRDFFIFYQCLGILTPCNITTHKLYFICEDICSELQRLIRICLLKFSSFFTPTGRAYAEQFDCSNPLTYSSSLTLDFYQLSNEATCAANRRFFGLDRKSDSGQDSGAVVGLIVGLTLVVGLVIVIVTIAFLYYKFKNRTPETIILDKDEMTSNPHFSDSTLKKSFAITSPLSFNRNDENDLMKSNTVPNCITVFSKILEEYKTELLPMMLQYSDVIVGEEIGQGAFGTVFKGQYSAKHGNSCVAIKTCKAADWSGDDMRSFLMECSKMSILQHPNVLGLVGICLDTEQGLPYMVMPFMSNGDLKQFLVSRRVSSDDVSVFPDGIVPTLLLQMVLDIAKGMEYLASHHFIHRDLAARNCMVDEELNVKIADFGLSRDIYESNYYVLRHSAKLPVRWMALESLLDGVFNITTDVWSYGVTCWEVYSLGRQPYPGLDHSDIAEHLSSGHRLRRPNLCPQSVYDVIQKCWVHKPVDRIGFSVIVVQLTQLMATDLTLPATEYANLRYTGTDGIAFQNEDAINGISQDTSNTSLHNTSAHQHIVVVSDTAQKSNNEDTEASEHTTPEQASDD